MIIQRTTEVRWYTENSHVSAAKHPFQKRHVNVSNFACADYSLIKSTNAKIEVFYSSLVIVTVRLNTFTHDSLLVRIATSLFITYFV